MRDWSREDPLSITPEEFATCQGADDPKWLKKRVDHYWSDEGCAASTPWWGNRFTRCTIKPAPGERYCAMHGGKKHPPKPAPTYKTYRTERGLRYIKHAIECEERTLASLRARLRELEAEREAQEV